MVLMEREGFLGMNGNGGAQLYLSTTVRSLSPTRSVPICPPPSAAVSVGANGGLNYIVHTVSKYDTLAGVAIKYGVEVADIKRLNGLVTDLQMFALKTIRIPLPGRHPPSPVSSNGHKTPPRPSNSQQTLSSRRHSDLFDSFSSLKLKSSSEQKLSPSMSRLQGYYGLKSAGLKSADTKGAAECEMAVYQNGRAHYLEDGPLPKSSISNPPLSHYRKSKSAADCSESENGSLFDQHLSQEAESNENARLIDKLIRRRQKSEADFTRTPEKLLKEENASGTTTSAITGKGLAMRPKSASRTVSLGVDGESGGFNPIPVGNTTSGITGKGLAMRPKSASRTVSLGVDGEAGGFNPIPVGLGDSFLTDDVNEVRKTSSASSLQDSDNGALSSMWPDFQALSAAATTIPIFDGLPMPSYWRNKAAVD